MKAADEYTTVSGYATAEIKREGSRFIAEVWPLADPSLAMGMVERTAKEYYDATHHCFAYRAGAHGEVFRSSDDGEPSGSAGKPILSVIDGAGVTDLLVVVTRYFGGTKLGVGGLVRAYGAAAASVLALAPRLTRRIEIEYIAHYDHPLTSVVLHAIAQNGARIVETTYDEKVHSTIAVRVSRAEDLTSRLVNATSGTIQLEKKLPA